MDTGSKVYPDKLNPVGFFEKVVVEVRELEDGTDDDVKTITALGPNQTSLLKQTLATEPGNGNYELRYNLTRWIQPPDPEGGWWSDSSKLGCCKASSSLWMLCICRGRAPANTTGTSSGRSRYLLSLGGEL